MQIEKPLLFFKSTHIDEDIFAQPLFNEQYLFDIETKQLTKSKENILKQTIPLSLLEKDHLLKTTWVIKVAQTLSKTQAVKLSEELQAEGLPAFYTKSQSQFDILIGPVIDQSIVKKWLPQVAKLQPHATIQQYQSI